MRRPVLDLFSMARNSASIAGILRSARMLTGAGLWLGVVGVTQIALGWDLGDAPRRIEEGIEQQLLPPQAPEGGHVRPAPSIAPDPIAPWELVSV